MLSTTFRRLNQSSRHRIHVAARRQYALDVSESLPTETPLTPVASLPKQTSTVEATSTTTVSSSNQEKNTATSERPKARKYKIPTRRPNISPENPRKWHPALRKGFLPAYDEALKLIREDSLEIKAEITDLKKQIAGAKEEGATDELAEMEKKLGILEVQSEINIPSVRWKFANGLGV